MDGEDLIGEVERVIWISDDESFAVADVRTHDEEVYRCTGPLAHLRDGQLVRLVGRLTDHPKHGETFVATYYEQVTPTTEVGLTAFLTSGPFDLTQLQAATLVTTFGLDTVRVIEAEHDRLREAGLDADEAQAVHEAWMAGQALSRLVRLVEPVGWPMDVVHAVHGRFGADADVVARRTPYRLLDAERVGFAHADALAMHLGVDPLDPDRLAAGAVSAVRAARRAEGHQCLPRPAVVEHAARLLQVDRVAASAGVDHAVTDGDLVVDEEISLDDAPAVYTAGGHRAEVQLAEAVHAIQSATNRIEVDPGPPSTELTEGQAVAVAVALDEPLSVITGGPGTGKTRTVAEIVAAARDASLDVALCAPTGRAAKRLEEVVGHVATTIHKLLEARPEPGGGFAFTRGPDEPLPHDLVIVDEVSMCDTSLARSLLGAVLPGSRVVLVGDPDQLPSVGPGDVLRDVIASGAVPVTNLTEIHRQAADSQVVALARAINDGDTGLLAGAVGDVFFAEERNAKAIVPRVVEAVAARAPEHFGVEVEDVQVIAPMYRGPAGVDALNAGLRERLNPHDGRVEVFGFCEGDRVLQTRNDAELDVANGDIGTVVDVSEVKRTVRVRFPRGEVTCNAEQARALTPAWAVTVHKSQGGEWPVIVLVCDRGHRRMLYRQLLYTAVTRAQQALIVVGQADLIAAGARVAGSGQRWTGLAQRLGG